MKRRPGVRLPLKNCNKALTQDQWSQFWRDGYVKVEGLLDKELLALIQEEHDRVCRDALVTGEYANFTDRSRAEEEDKVVNIQQMCELSTPFRRLLYHQPMLDIVEDLIGPNIQLFHDHLLLKPPRHGGPVFWHQDNQAWQCVPASNVTCWMAFDDADSENGTLQYVRGSHRNTMGMEVGSEDGRLLDIDRIIEEGQIDIVEAKAGDALFHHCLTLHNSEANRSDRTRRAHSIHFAVTGTRCGRLPPWNERENHEGQHLPHSFGHPVLRSSAAD